MAIKTATLAVELSTGEDINNLFRYMSPSVTPELSPHLSALTPPSPTTKSATQPPMFVTTSTQTTPTHEEQQAFLLKQSLQAIEKQLQLSNTRLEEMERILTRQGNILKELVSTCPK